MGDINEYKELTGSLDVNKVALENIDCVVVENILDHDGNVGINKGACDFDLIVVENILDCDWE